MLPRPPPPAGTGARMFDALAQLRSMRQAGCRWLVLLSSGGHFAAAVMDMVGGARNAEEALQVVAHKTFHRYVVRAKAGGRQSSKDASGKGIKSAGAQLRRYNEAALEADIQGLLREWAPLLEIASCLFVHAPAVNGKAVFAGADAPLRLSDERVRRVPFVVRRPTFSEVKRVAQRLAQVYSVPYEPKAQQQEQPPPAAVAAGKQQPKAVPSASTAAAAAAAGKSKETSASTVDEAIPGAGGELRSHPISVPEDKSKDGPVSKSKKRRQRMATKKQRHGGLRSEAAEEGSGTDGDDAEAGPVARQPAAAAADAGVDEIDAALAQIAALNVKSKSKAAAKGGGAQAKPKAGSADARAQEAAARRDLAAAAAERRMQALQNAAKQQQLW